MPSKTPLFRPEALKAMEKPPVPQVLWDPFIQYNSYWRLGTVVACIVVGLGLFIVSR